MKNMWNLVTIPWSLFPHFRGKTITAFALRRVCGTRPAAPPRPTPQPPPLARRALRHRPLPEWAGIAPRLPMSQDGGGGSDGGRKFRPVWKRPAELKSPLPAARMAGFAIDPPPAGEPRRFWRRCLARTACQAIGRCGAPQRLAPLGRSASSDTGAGRGKCGGRAGRSCGVGWTAMRRAREGARARRGFSHVGNTLQGNRSRKRRGAARSCFPFIGQAGTPSHCSFFSLS